MEHVLHVSSIAAVIGRCLNLNIDLINAIAKGHDLGHPPYGHAGERVLDKILKQKNVKKVSSTKFMAYGWLISSQIMVQD